MDRQSPPTSDSFLVATTTASEATWNCTRSRPTRRQASNSARVTSREESTTSISPEHSAAKAASSPSYVIDTSVLVPLWLKAKTSSGVSEPRLPLMRTVPLVGCGSWR